MYFELKENRPHGTPENPFSQYHISDVKRAFQIPVHWHDELEIIYVKQGKLHVTISGEKKNTYTAFHSNMLRNTFLHAGRHG